MNTLKTTILALALAGAFPTQAADPAADDTRKEVQALKARVSDLEKALKAGPAPAGMTEEQEKDFNRIKVKTEALEDNTEASGLKGLKITGYMDPTYVYNFNKERGTFVFLVPIAKEPYNYDVGYFGTMALDIQKETESGTKFHLTIYPKRGGGDVMGENSIVHEASVWIPLGGLDTKLFAGQLPDWSGYEYYAPAGPNSYKNITHNMLFDFTLPSSYTGMGIEFVSPRLDLKLMLANMNSSVRNVGENVPMFVCRGDYTPKGTDYWGLGFACALGYKTNFRAAPQYDAAGNPIDPAHLDGKDSLYGTLEVDGWYTRGRVTLNGHVTYGRQAKAAITAAADGALRDAQWFGASVLGAYKFTERLEGVLRLDAIFNRTNGGGLLDYTVADAGNGIGPGQSPGADPNQGANRYAITAGVNYALNSNVVLKAEYRFDGADKDVFGNKDVFTGGPNPKYTKNNSLLAADVVFFF